MAVALQKGVKYTLQDEATVSGNGNVAVVPDSHEALVIFIIGAGTITGGSIQIEESHDPDYAGDWSLIQSINATVVNSDAVLAIHASNKYFALRARIDSDITGGGDITVTIFSGD